MFYQNIFIICCGLCIVGENEDMLIIMVLCRGFQIESGVSFMIICKDFVQIIEKKGEMLLCMLGCWFKYYVFVFWMIGIFVVGILFGIISW